MIEIIETIIFLTILVGFSLSVYLVLLRRQPLMIEIIKTIIFLTILVGFSLSVYLVLINEREIGVTPTSPHHHKTHLH